MTGELMQTKHWMESTEDVRNKLGQLVYDCTLEDDNFPYEIGKSIVDVVMGCQTQRELDVANQMIIAITGYSLETIMEKVDERDQAEADVLKEVSR